MTIYNDHILELYEDRSNFGHLDSKTHTLKHSNPVCNDEVTLELEIKEGKIVDAKFNGISCFVSVVSASALISKIKGMNVDDVLKFSKKDVDDLLGIKITPTRLRCELLPLEALKKLK